MLSRRVGAGQSLASLQCVVTDATLWGAGGALQGHAGTSRCSHRAVGILLLDFSQFYEQAPPLCHNRLGHTNPQWSPKAQPPRRRALCFLRAGHLCGHIVLQRQQKWDSCLQRMLVQFLSHRTDQKYVRCSRLNEGIKFTWTARRLRVQLPKPKSAQQEVDCEPQHLLPRRPWR